MSGTDNDSEEFRQVHRAKSGVTFIVFSALFGPFLLRDPPLFGGYSHRNLVAIGIGLGAWGLVLEGLLGIPSALFEVTYP